DDDELYGVRVTGTRNVLDAFPQARIVHLSSTAVYSVADTETELWEEAGPKDPTEFPDAYSRTHALAELLVARIRPDAAILRPAAVYGPGETMFMPYLASLVKKGVLRLPGGGRQKLTLTHVDNVVRAALACLDVPSAAGPFNIGDPTPYRLKDAVVTHFARMGYEQVVIDAVAKDKALVTARLGLRVKRVVQRGNRTRRALVHALPVPVAGFPVPPQTVAPDAASGSAGSRPGGRGLSVGGRAGRPRSSTSVRGEGSF